MHKQLDMRYYMWYYIKMKRIEVVLDTNVLYAGLYSSEGASFRILSGIQQRILTPVLSTSLLFEYEEVLRRNQETLKLSSMEIENLLDELCLYAVHQEIYFLWRPQLPDPKDDHILELAFASEANVIVTHNLKDFTRAPRFGVRVLKPKDFLEVMK